MTFMQFQPINDEPEASTHTSPRTAPKGKAVNTPRAPKKTASPASRATQNLLVHIPGEASGFYMLGIQMIGAPAAGGRATGATVVGVCALILLIVVRKLAGATVAVMV